MAKVTTKKVQSQQDSDTVDWIIACRNEAEESKRERMDKNTLNFDMYHMKQDYSHKISGQSREVLSKQALAVEQISSFFQQALIDIYEWWRVNPTNKAKENLMVMKPAEIFAITDNQLTKADMYSHVGQGVKSGLLGALIISKVHGVMVNKPKFEVKKKGRGKSQTKRVVKKEDKAWQLQLDLVRQKNYYPDPNGTRKMLYEIEDMWMDFHEVKALSVGEDAIYDSTLVNTLSRGMSNDAEDERRKHNETDQTANPTQAHRARIKLTEFWGTILDDQGEIVFENCVATIANDTHLIRRPEANPNWHQKSPYIIGSLIEVPHAVWPKAMMDAPTRNNIMINELYNLTMDGAMNAAHDIKQVRMDYLEDPNQVANGIKPGATIGVNSSAPPGAKVIETVTTGNVPPEAIQMLNLANQEFNASALTNDLRQGVLPSRSVKATEVVEASQTITSIFNGMAKNIETKWIQRILERAWMETAQHYDKLDLEETKELIGEQRTLELTQLDPEDVFTQTVNGVKFKAYGITQILQRSGDFRKWTTLLQTIGASPIFQEAFAKENSFERLLLEIMDSLDIRREKIKRPDVEIGQAGEAAQAAGGEAEEVPVGEANQISQAPQAQSLSDIFGGDGGIPQTEFAEGPAV